MVSQYFGKSTVEYHRRHFVLRPNQLEYYRMLTLDTAGTKRLFLLSEIDSITLVDADDAATSEAEVDVEGTFAPSSSLSTFEALGLTLKWPIVEGLSNDGNYKTNSARSNCLLHQRNFLRRYDRGPGHEAVSN